MGSKSGGGGNGMQTVTQKTELPQWVQDALASGKSLDDLAI